MIGLSSRKKLLLIGLFFIGGLLLSNGVVKISFAGGDLLSEGFILHKAITKLIQGQEVTEYTIATTTITPVRHLDGVLTTIINHENLAVTGNVYSRIILETQEAWTADNEITYAIISEVKGTDKVADMFFLTVYNATSTIEDMLESDIEEYKKQFLNEGLIQMQEIKPNIWAKEGNFIMPLKGPLQFAGGYGILTSETSGNVYPMGAKTIVELESPSVKIQADAARALINQVNQSAITNHIIEGLTWILISVIPIGFGFDIILREHYHNKTKNNTSKNNSK